VEVHRISQYPCKDSCFHRVELIHKADGETHFTVDRMEWINVISFESLLPAIFRIKETFEGRYERGDLYIEMLIGKIEQKLKEACRNEN
jgi:hypothetical protein